MCKEKVIGAFKKNVIAIGNIIIFLMFTFFTSDLSKTNISMNYKDFGYDNCVN